MRALPDHLIVKQTQNAGTGLFLKSSGDGPDPILAVPSNEYFSAFSALREPVVINHLQFLFTSTDNQERYHGSISEKVILTLFLACYKDQSHSFPPSYPSNACLGEGTLISQAILEYVTSLPDPAQSGTYSDPPVLSRDHTLYKAIKAKQKAVERTWRLFGVFERGTREGDEEQQMEGKGGGGVTFESWKWADGTLVSRSLGLHAARRPLPFSSPPPSPSHISPVPSDANKPTRLVNLLKSLDRESWLAFFSDELITTQIADLVLVPILDLCNHASRGGLDRTARWDLIPFFSTLECASPGSTRGENNDETIILVADGNRPDSSAKSEIKDDRKDREREVTISYGDKGNEELFFCYGFIQLDNPVLKLSLSVELSPILYLSEQTGQREDEEDGAQCRELERIEFWERVFDRFGLRPVLRISIPRHKDLIETSAPVSYEGDASNGSEEPMLAIQKEWRDITTDLETLAVLYLAANPDLSHDDRLVNLFNQDVKVRSDSSVIANTTTRSLEYLLALVRMRKSQVEELLSVWEDDGEFVCEKDEVEACHILERNILEMQR